MNFFERQDAAKGTSVKLVVLFVVAVVALVGAIDAVAALVMTSRQSTPGSVVSVVIVVSILTLLVIAGGMVSKTVSLRQGGSAVAASVGAVPIDPTTSDPQLSRFVNIVEEMSLASGVPVPRLFVMRNEPGINAFAAGYTPADAAITVTQGALDNLNRDELQGVIGHEFSHILNGDMRLNIRLIGLLSGILLIGLIGLRVLQFGPRGGDRRNGAPILAIALAMLVLGFIGVFFANVMKAAVSRQREWLADASSVQFTRQTTGLEGAFKKIASLEAGSTLHDTRSATEVSHMLFGEGGRSFTQLLATHPPLYDRIKALDPSFTPEQFAELSGGTPSSAERHSPAEVRSSGFAGQAQPAPIVTTPQQVVARAGTLTHEDMARGAALSAQLPPELRQLAGQTATAVPLVLAMLLGADTRLRANQLATITQRLGAATAQATQQIAPRTDQLAELLHLPLVSVALPTLALRPRSEIAAVLTTLNEIALADGVVSLYEYCLTRVVWSYLTDAGDPKRRSRIGSASLDRQQHAVTTVLTAIGAAGALPASPGAPIMPSWQELDAAWPVLDALAPPDKQRLVEKLVEAVLADGVLATGEAELLRAACVLVHVPMPALVA